MFRSNYKNIGEKSVDNQLIVCVASPLYTEFIDNLIDDFISLRFYIIHVRYFVIYI